MERRFLSSDPITGVDTFHEYDHLTDETRIIYLGDASALIDENKRLANDSEYTKKGIKQEFWKYASIPAIIQTKWLIEHGVDVWNRDHGPAMGKLLEDPQYRYLKTTTRHHKIKGRG